VARIEDAGPVTVRAGLTTVGIDIRLPDSDASAPMARRVERADVAMPKPGAVAGRVVDEFGDPAPGILVRLATTDFAAGMARLVPFNSWVTPQPTDDTGAFRIFDVPPGDYYVTALSGAFVPGSDMRGFAMTLYPGTHSGAQARAVHVVAGTDALGTDFPVIPASLSDVRGTVVTQDGVPVPHAYVGLMPATAGDVRIMLTRASTTTDADGSFVFRNIPVGAYAMQAEVPAWAVSASGSTVPLFGYAAVDASGPTPAGLRIAVQPPATLRGRVVFEGPGPHPSGRDVLIDEVATEFMSGPYETHVRVVRWADQNTFTIESLVGRLVVRAAVQPDVWILTRVTLAGTDVTDAPIDFGRGDVDDLEITFERIGASVSGTVTHGDLPPGDYSVIVFASDPLKWAWPSRVVRLARPEKQGGYRVTGLPSGQYLAIAVPQVSGGRWQDPEWLRTLVGLATPFTLQDGEAQSLTLKLVK
jgi:protocatechuate 3,4-dioxygenase beta subunit